MAKQIKYILTISILLLQLLPNFDAANAQNRNVQTSYLPLNIFAGWGGSGQGSLVTCLALDLRGHVWAGTEDTGVWVNNASAQGGVVWTGYASGTGLADNTCTALLCDAEGRIWAGTLNHGVSVFNGRTWKNYDTTDGPLGSHILAIAENPTDHSIWIADDDGISRYDQSAGTWSYITKADGLPSNQPTAIAFDSSGNIYVGTACDGLGIATSASGYKTWQTIPGPFRPTHAGGGTGLPSEVINSISVGKGVVYVGTDWGLAETTDSGATWHYIRGGEWKALANGEFPPPSGALPIALNATMLSDYVTCLCQDESGNLWVGHRDYGAEVFETTTFQRTGQTASSAADYVTCMMPTSQGMVFGTLGGGVNVLSSDPALNNQRSPPAVAQIASLPTPAPPPTAADLSSMEGTVENLTGKIKPGDAYYLGDDWDTQGNWVSHYGKQWALLCESWDGSQNDLFTDDRISSGSFSGPTSVAGDGLRSWVANPDSKSRSALYDPLNGKRPISNWNDNAEVSPATTGGGDLWYTITVPDGVYCLSTYFLNDDGDSGGNRDRDYLEEIRPHASDNSKVTVDSPPLAVARIVNFRTGVYESFVICGPSTYDVRVNRNGSMNGMISAYFVDKLAGPTDPSDTANPSWLHGVPFTAPTIAPAAATDQSASAVALALWGALDRGYSSPSALPIEHPYRILAYRAALSAPASDDTLEAMRWLTHIWTGQDNLKFDALTTKAFETNPIPSKAQ